MITLKTLGKSSAQEVFDQVAVHLLTQNKKSMGGDKNFCMYHSKSGLKCAAGCLIADDEYEHTFECNNWYTLANDGIFNKKHKRLIGDLQSIHDYYDIGNWKSALTELADDYNLNTNNIIFRESNDFN